MFKVCKRVLRTKSLRNIVLGLFWMKEGVLIWEQYHTPSFLAALFRGILSHAWYVCGAMLPPCALLSKHLE